MTAQITIWHIRGCPNAALARERVDAALSRLASPPPTVVMEEVLDPDHAARIGFPGSPTLLFDGVDPFASRAAPPAFACRTFPSGAGSDGAPSLEQIVAALGTTGAS